MNFQNCRTMATNTIQTKAEAHTLQFSLWKYSIAGVLAGLIAGIANNVWILIYPFVSGMDAPPGVDAMSVSVFSFLPMLLAGFFYYFISMKNASRGTKIFIGLGIVAFLASLYGPLNPDQLGALFQAGEVPAGFALFTIPMHIIAALTALVFMPRFVMSE